MTTSFAAAADVHNHSVIFKPSVGFQLSHEIADTSSQSEVVGDLSGPDGPSETLEARHMDPASTGPVSVYPFSVCSVPVHQTLDKD